MLCEKPLALSAEDLPAARRRSPARRSARSSRCTTGSTPRRSRRSRSSLRGGSVGAVRSVRWETLRSQPAVAAGEKGNWRVDPAQSGGGILVDHGWHALYVLRQWLGGSPQAVSARLETRKHREFAIEDTATVRLDWNGAACEVFLTWAAPERRNRVAIEGDRGRLSLDGGRIALEGDGGVQALGSPVDRRRIAPPGVVPRRRAGISRGGRGAGLARPEFRGGRALRDAPRPGPGIERSGGRAARGAFAMTAAALALVGPAGAPAVAPETMLLGLPMIRRTVLAAQRAGFRRVAVVGGEGSVALGRAPRGNRGRAAAGRSGGPGGRRGDALEPRSADGGGQGARRGSPADGLGVEFRARVGPPSRGAVAARRPRQGHRGLHVAPLRAEGLARGQPPPRGRRRSRPTP